MIYDLGGGTFDVSIIEIRDRVFEVKATGGDIFLGGLDFDQAMIQLVLQQFHELHGIDLSNDPVAMQRIKDLAERTKIDLSFRESAPFSVPFVTMTAQGQPLNVEFTFTRKMLEELTEPLVDRSIAILERVMNDAGLTPDKVDELLLVGGQTRMPIVQRRLSERFGRAPSKGVHPDEAVAIGAALYAESLQDNSELRLQLLDVIPMAIGLERAGGEFHVVFSRNAAIPNAKAIEATTSFDNQTEVAMRIFQGDSPTVARQQVMLGDFLFSGTAAQGPTGTARLEITFSVNIEGILTMSARDLETGKQMKTTVRVTRSAERAPAAHNAGAGARAGARHDCEQVHEHDYEQVHEHDYEHEQVHEHDYEQVQVQVHKHEHEREQEQEHVASRSTEHERRARARARGRARATSTRHEHEQEQEQEQEQRARAGAGEQVHERAGRLRRTAKDLRSRDHGQARANDFVVVTEPASWRDCSRGGLDLDHQWASWASLAFSFLGGEKEKANDANGRDADAEVDRLPGGEGAAAGRDRGEYSRREAAGSGGAGGAVELPEYRRGSGALEQGRSRAGLSHRARWRMLAEPQRRSRSRASRAAVIPRSPRAARRSLRGCTRC